MSLNIVQIKPTEFELSSAAMPPVYHYVAATNQVEEILIEGLPLGGLREEHFNIITRSFSTGDIIVQLSDGLPEAPNLVGEMYDYERLGQLIEINGSKSAQGMIDSLIASVDSWLQGKHNPDDITLVVIKKK
jgi:serine phosphatase RsbU (regulator of sigma subunit)